MNISKVQEESTQSTGSYPVYTGIENFKVVAVNPTMAELQAMGIPATEEPNYNQKLERNGEKVDSFTIRIFLDNEDPNMQIKTSVAYTVLKTNQFSSTEKYKVINAYGGTTWLKDEEVSGKEPIPDNIKKWYVTDKVKKALIGEEELISFIRAHRNFPNINNTASEEEKQKSITIFEQKDLDKMFAGDFKDIRNVIMDARENSIGFLLGARQTDNGNKQGLFSRNPLRAYMKHNGNTEYLIRDVKEAQENGVMSTTIFNLEDLKLKEFKEEDIHNLQEEEHDDLPF